MEDKNYIIDSSSSISFNNGESYKLDWSKIKTVEDCVLLIKCCLIGWSKGFEHDIRIYESSPMYEQMKHLAVEEEN